MAKVCARRLGVVVVPLLIFLAALGTASTAAAQGAPGLHIGVSGGAVFPVEDQSDIYNTGWEATLMFNWNFGDSPFGVRLDGTYGELQTKDSLVGFLGNGKTRIIDGTFDFVIGPHIGPYVQPYILGGVGGYDLRFQGQEVDTGNLFSDSTTRFGWNAGTGIAFRLGSTTNAHVFVEGRYTSISIDSDRFTNSIHTDGRRFTVVMLNSGFIF
jgi:opacity protein-like surface antigen